MDKINELAIKELEAKVGALEKTMSSVLKKLDLDDKKTKKPKSTTLGDTLYETIPAYEYVEITDGGWRIGFTYIDDEDLFMQSLNPKLLDREVEQFYTRQNKDFVKPIYRVELK